MPDVHLTLYGAYKSSQDYAKAADSLQKYIAGGSLGPDELTNRKAEVKTCLERPAPTARSSDGQWPVAAARQPNGKVRSNRVRTLLTLEELEGFTMTCPVCAPARFHPAYRAATICIADWPACRV